MTTADASNNDGDKSTDGETRPDAADTKPDVGSAEKKTKLTGRKKNAALGVGIGIGSAALVAALLYASRHKPGQRHD